MILRKFKIYFVLIAALSLIGCRYEAPQKHKPDSGGNKMETKIIKTNEEWKHCLTPEQYRIARLKGTEAPFTGKYNNNYDPGTYKCVCCGEQLFSSGTKFKSGTGWPSFYEAMNEENIKVETDYSHGMIRKEISCANCGAHLGHVFDDGPDPTGLRYCINSESLDFEPESKEEK